MSPSDRDKLTRRMLKQYQRLRHAQDDAEEDIAGRQLPSMDYGRPMVQGGAGGDLVSITAMAHMDVDRTRGWITAIDSAMAELEEFYPSTAEIIRRHFRMRFSAGYKHTHVRKMRDTICEVQHINVSEYYNRLNAGVDTVIYYAGERGLFRMKK